MNSKCNNFEYFRWAMQIVMDTFYPSRIPDENMGKISPRMTLKNSNKSTRPWKQKIQLEHHPSK